MRKYVTTARVPLMPISIEYEDNDYTYISSHYQHKKLKADIETIKRPITIHYSETTAICR